MPEINPFLPDEHLMRGVQNGSDADFECLYSRYARRMLGFFFRMFRGNEEKAQDFLQDLFMRVLEKAETFDPDKNFETWIFTVASNMCKNEFRNLNNHQVYMQREDPDEIYWQNTESEIDHRNYQTAIKQLVDALEPDKKELFVLRFEEELSIEKIAEVLSTKEGTIKSRLFYLKRLLADKLKIFDPNLKD